jgi:hypothetical protein
MDGEITIERFGYTPFGAFGCIYAPRNFECYSIERPYVLTAPNAPRLSCIPEGIYGWRLSTFNKPEVPYPCIELIDVPGRTYIKSHAGNRAIDLLGCIAPGLRLGSIGGQWAVLDSKAAHKQFMASLGGAESGTIEIYFKASSRIEVP